MATDNMTCPHCGQSVIPKTLLKGVPLTKSAPCPSCGRAVGASVKTALVRVVMIVLPPVLVYAVAARMIPGLSSARRGDYPLLYVSIIGLLILMVFVSGRVTREYPLMKR